jgi:hypothetical protein
VLVTSRSDFYETGEMMKQSLKIMKTEPISHVNSRAWGRLTTNTWKRIDEEIGEGSYRESALAERG